MFFGQKVLHRTATMAGFRVTDVNAGGFAAMRGVLDGTAPVAWLHGRRRSGKGYALSAIYRARLDAEPTAVHLYMDGAYLPFALAGARRKGTLDAFQASLAASSTLLIDDVEHLVGNSEREAFLYQIVMSRSAKELPTVLTSTHHPLTFLPETSMLRIMLRHVSTAGLTPLLLRERRAVVEHEASLLVPETPPQVLPFLLKHGGDTECELRQTTRRVLFTACHQLPLPGVPASSRAFDALRRG
jgi:chromosomal replication initiation ATPase DnaA